ncbi:Uncharacterized protein FWK35_00018746 [Aphis craccivora]|uniref:Uncharacterized protein n=1 Tax=Aphis craccivora TaxID=307492 RepID=A0A6G0YXN0_APHCR|nr:Uncharacterized protein FWK35_00018746 [Aphis craccivora]
MDTGQYEQRTITGIATGHIWRDKDSLMRLVLVTKFNKTCPRKRPLQRWLDRVKTNLNQAKKISSIQNADKRNRWSLW